MTAKEALEHEWFSSEPLPCKPIEYNYYFLKILSYSKSLNLEKYQECHITLMSLERNRRKKAEEETNLRKRRFSEFDKKGKPGNLNTSHAQEKQYSFRSPDTNEIQTQIARSQSYTSHSEMKIESQMPTQPETDGGRTYERFSGISTLFSSMSHQSTSEKKPKDEGNYLSSLLQSSEKKKGNQNGQNEYKSNSYKKVHM